MLSSTISSAINVFVCNVIKFFFFRKIISSNPQIMKMYSIGNLIFESIIELPSETSLYHSIITVCFFKWCSETDL